MCKSQKLVQLKTNTKVLKRDLKTFEVGIILTKIKLLLTQENTQNNIVVTSSNALND